MFPPPSQKSASIEKKSIRIEYAARVFWKNGGMNSTIFTLQKSVRIQKKSARIQDAPRVACQHGGMNITFFTPQKSPRKNPVIRSEILGNWQAAARLNGENSGMKISLVFKNNLARVQAVARVLCKNGGMNLTPQTAAGREKPGKSPRRLPLFFLAPRHKFSLQTFSL